MQEEEFNKGQEYLNEKFEKIRSGLPGKVKELETLLHKYDPFNIIANISLRQHIYPATNPSIAVSEQVPVIVEYITLLYLKKPYYVSIGEIVHARDMLGDIAQIIKLAEELVFQNSLFLHEHHSKSGDETLEFILQSLTTEEYFVRNPAIEEHHWEVFEGIYKPYDKLLRQQLGFDALDGRDLCGCIQEFLLDRFQELKKEYTSIWQPMFQEVMLFRKKGKKPHNFYPDETLAQLSAITEVQLKNHFIGFAETRMAHFLGQKLSFTAEELADYSGIDLEIVNNFLRQLASPFNSIDPKFEQMATIHPMKDKPIVEHDGRFLCPSLSLLDWAVDRLFYSLLVSKKPKFILTKHDYVLEKGIAILQKMLVSGTAYQQLKYHDGNNGELDGLILYDNHAFFIEVKGNAVTDKAKGGNLNKIKDHIDDIIDHSHQQAVRAARYFQSAPITQYKNKQGQIVKINSEYTEHVFYISLSLDPIANIANHIKVDNSLNLFNQGTIPWVVNLYDLMVIGDFIEGPSFFIHFLLRRSEFFKAKKMQIIDELDVMMYYLQYGLHFDDLEKDKSITQFNFESQGQAINDYYFYRSGRSRKKADRPQHYAIYRIKQLINKIDPMLELRKRTDFTLELLSLDTKSQRTFVENLDKYKKLFKKDGDIHDFSLNGTYKGKAWGITYFMAKNTPENLELFHRFCTKKSSDRSAARWVGIYDCGQKDAQFIDAYSYILAQSVT